MTDDAVNTYSLLVVGLAIAIVIFLVMHPLNVPSCETSSLRSLLTFFCSP
jgi:hypothetical protein